MFSHAGFSTIYELMLGDFRDRVPINFHKNRSEGICMLSSLILEVGSINLMDLAAVLPRNIASADHRYQYIERQLGNRNIDRALIMRGFAQDIFAKLHASDQTIILMLDQSKVNDGHEVLMLSVRVGERALPVHWEVVACQGSIGFEIQEKLLDEVVSWLPKEANIMLAGDRFYGSRQLIQWCQKAGWDYRLRLKKNFNLWHQGAETNLGAIAKSGETKILNATLFGEIKTHIGILHEASFDEAWIIAMGSKPNQYRVRDYGMRWGIEAMFSDFKSRGFGITKTQLRSPNKIANLILVSTIALYWAVSTGMAEASQITPKLLKKALQRSQEALYLTLNADGDT